MTHDPIKAHIDPADKRAKAQAFDKTITFTASQLVVGYL